MMSYSNGFVVSIKNNKNEVLRESNGREVFLPFDSEYSLLLKNNNNRKAVATVEIDGTNVLGEHELIVPAWGSTTLERFCINGNLSNGNRFKFVKSTDSKVQDPTSPLNGRVKVTFRLEEERKQVIFTKSRPVFGDPKDWPAPEGYWCHQTFYGTDDLKCKGLRSMSFSCDSPSASDSFSLRDADSGATVEGSTSNQNFVLGSTRELESTTTEIIMWIRPAKQNDPVTVKDTRYIFCSECGTRMPNKSKYCSACGHSLRT
jgi:hypothetical protein